MKNTASAAPPVRTAPTKAGAINISFSGSIPANYDAHLGPMFFEPFAKELTERIDLLAPSAVLELACGTGRLTRHLAERLPRDTRIVSTDINPAMLAFAQESVSVKGIEWSAVDAVQLPYPDASFDLVVVQFGVMFYSDRSKAYREALRVLRPGGRLLFTTWNSMEHNPVAHATQRVIEQFFPVDPPAFYTVPFAYHDRGLMQEELRSSGFDRVELVLLELHGKVPTAADAAMGLLEGSPIHTAIMDRDPFLLPQMRTALEQRLAERFGTQGLEVPVSAWVAEAVKH